MGQKTDISKDKIYHVLKKIKKALEENRIVIEAIRFEGDILIETITKLFNLYRQKQEIFSTERTPEWFSNISEVKIRIWKTRGQ